MDALRAVVGHQEVFGTPELVHEDITGVGGGEGRGRQTLKLCYLIFKTAHNAAYEKIRSFIRKK